MPMAKSEEKNVSIEDCECINASNDVLIQATGGGEHQQLCSYGRLPSSRRFVGIQ